MSTPQERWEPVEGFPGYEVSNLGRVKGKLVAVLKPRLSGHGYLKVVLCVKGKPVNHFVHRLVAKAFVPGWFEGAEVNHLDACKTNNFASNLEWCTSKQNCAHAIALGLHPRGESHGNTRLTEKDVVMIRWLIGNGWHYRELGRQFGVSHPNIFDIAHRRTWGHVA